MTGNLRTVQILLGHTNIENTVRYLGVDVDDALTLYERTEILHWFRLVERYWGPESSHEQAACINGPT